MELGKHNPALDVLRLCSTRDWRLTINDLWRMAVSQTASPIKVTTFNRIPIAAEKVRE
jgi:hypothetical protein